MALAVVQSLEVGSEKWGAVLRKRARALARSVDEANLELAELLYTVAVTPVEGVARNPPIFTSWGYSTFEEYVNTELGLQRKKAQSLQRIWAIIIEAGLDKSLQRRLIKVGWTKVRELVRVLSANNAVQWIEMAEKMTYVDLVANIQLAIEKAEQQRAVSGETGEEVEIDPPSEKEKKSSMSFALYPEQRENIELALKRASEMAESEHYKRNHHLDLICTDFLATNDFKLAKDPEMRYRMLAKYERMFGIRIVVVDPVKRKITYGIEALELCALEGGDE